MELRSTGHHVLVFGSEWSGEAAGLHLFLWNIDKLRDVRVREKSRDIQANFPDAFCDVCRLKQTHLGRSLGHRQRRRGPLCAFRASQLRGADGSQGQLAWHQG